MKKNKYITIRLDEKLYNDFTSHIKANLLNSAAVIRDLLQKYVCDNTRIEFNTPSRTAQPPLI